MKRVGKGSSGRVTPLFQTMVRYIPIYFCVEGLANPTDPHHTPTIIQSSTQPQKTQQPRKPKRKDTRVPQPSDPSENVTDEVFHKELGDSLVMAATTASSLEAKQDNGGGPRCQETLGDTIAQTRFENVSKHSNDSLLARGNVIQSDEDRLKLDELMALCTTLQNRVLDLEKIKTTQHNEIVSLKRRVKNLKKKNSVQNVDEEMLDVNVLDGEEMFVAEQEVAANKENDEVNVVKEVEVMSAAGNVVSTASAATTISVATTTTDDDGDITLTQALIEMKSYKPRWKGCKGILIELVKPMKKKDQIRRDEEAALKLQAEFDEEERLAREKAKKEKEANIALIETWDDIQAKIDADHQLAERLQSQEQEELYVEEKATLFQQLLEKRRKHFAAKRAELKEFDFIQEMFDRAFKRQKVEDEKEIAELKQFLEIIPDEEEVTIDVIPLAVKSPNKYGSTRSVEDLDLTLCGDLKTMFEPHVEDKVWKNQQDYKVLNWKLYDSCGVHFLRMQHMQIYMLVEKKYPFTPSTLTMMLEKKLMIDYESKMAYQLLKFIIKQLKK
ncbi:hypothetical protein Tco_0659652 [Tanacetum coccineum]